MSNLIVSNTVESLAYDLADWLKYLSDDLESEVQGRYVQPYDELHPALKRRYTRDMQPVVQARALLRHARDVLPDWPRPEPTYNPTEGEGEA